MSPFARQRRDFSNEKHSHLCAGESTPEDALLLQMGRIGIDRFLFGSDYNVPTPAEAFGTD